MISQTSDDSISCAPPVAEGPATDSIKVQQSTPKRKFAVFSSFWRRETLHAKSGNECQREEQKEAADNRIIQSKLRNGPAAKTSLDFFRNMKKHVHFKSLTVCKSKQKMREIGTHASLNDSETKHDSNKANEAEKSMKLALKAKTTDRPADNANAFILSRNGHSSDEDVARILRSDTEIETEAERENVPIETRLTNTDICQTLAQDTIYSTILNPQTEIVRWPTTSDAVANDSSAKASLTEELLKLSRHGWYWGPISGEEADAKLVSEPDGAFLVRDSADDRYVLTLSFKSSGKLLHARMGHSGGLFSLSNQSEIKGFTSVDALIHYSMYYCQSAAFYYSRPKYPGYPSFPVRLTKPVSRFTHVRSLQYLCRFVIRQNTRLDNIHKLPLPKRIQGYIEEGHY